MNLKNKKELAAKALGVGKNRIFFSPEGLPEIKEAITKQDIHSLNKEGIITIKPIKGRKKIIRRKIRRGAGKIKRKIKKRKQNYVLITRKLRKYLKMLKNQNAISNELYWELRTKIKMRTFKNAAHFKEYLENERKIGEISHKKKLKKVRDEKIVKEIKPKKLETQTTKGGKKQWNSIKKED